MPVPFGLFTLLDAAGESVAAVVVAPECILMQRVTGGAVHDVSYLMVWSGSRVEAVTEELKTVAAVGQLTGSSPELLTLFRSIEPTAMPVFLQGGDCRKTFSRRRLRAALNAQSAIPARAPSGSRP